MSRRIREIAGKGKMRVVGLMSGTSADGVDAAVVEIDRGKVRLLAFEMFSYPAALRRRILGLCRPESARLDDICHYNFVLGEVFADAIVKLCSKSGIALRSIDLIGSHGQTIYHQANAMAAGRYVLSCRSANLQLSLSVLESQRSRISGPATWLPAAKVPRWCRMRIMFC